MIFPWKQLRRDVYRKYIEIYELDHEIRKYH